MKIKELLEYADDPAVDPNNIKGVKAYGQHVTNTVRKAGRDIEKANAEQTGGGYGMNSTDAQITQQRKANRNFQKGVDTVGSNKPDRKDVDNSQPTDSTTTVTKSGYRGGGGYGHGERTATTAIATGQDTTGTDMRTNLDRAYQDAMEPYTSVGGSIAPTGKDNFKDANYYHLQNPETGEVTKHAKTDQEKATWNATDSMTQGAGETDILGDLPDGGAALKQIVGMDPNDAVSVKNLGKMANAAYNKAAAMHDKEQAAKFQQQARARKRR